MTHQATRGAPGALDGPSDAAGVGVADRDGDGHNDNDDGDGDEKVEYAVEYRVVDVSPRVREAIEASLIANARREDGAPAGGDADAVDADARRRGGGKTTNACVRRASVVSPVISSVISCDVIRRSVRPPFPR